MKKLELGYAHGFTDGLKKAREIIAYISEDMRYHKRRITPKELEKILDIAIDGREKLREHPNAFIRCIDGGYELYEGRD